MQSTSEKNEIIVGYRPGRSATHNTMITDEHPHLIGDFEKLSPSGPTDRYMACASDCRVVCVVNTNTSTAKVEPSAILLVERTNHYRKAPDACVVYVPLPKKVRGSDTDQEDVEG